MLLLWVAAVMLAACAACGGSTETTDYGQPG